LVSLLRCPRTHGPLDVFGVEVLRGGGLVRLAPEEKMEDDDDIILGLLLERDGEAVYPIVDSVASMLCQDDLDPLAFVGLLDRVAEHLPPSLAALAGAFSARIGCLGEDSASGRWNRGEMAFFDRDVDTPELREAFAARIRTEPLWSRYLPRETEIVARVRDRIAHKSVLEIGCGNSRTVSWLLPPARHGYHYVGTDVSFKRLLLARLVVPEGDFIQCSALRLPLATSSLDGVLSFGVLHHLPDPLAGVRESTRLVKPGGFFAFHEPIAKPRLMGGRLRGDRENEHDGEIDLDQVRGVLTENAFEIRSQRLELSWAGTLLNKVVGCLPASVRTHRLLYVFALAVDRFFISTVSHLVPQTGPAGALLVAAKDAGDRGQPGLARE
jgi:SAM-dependent methyltransferase